MRHSVFLDGLVAVIYVPYGVFYSWSFVMGGTTCGASPTDCWFPEFAKLPVFVLSRNSPRGTCGRDMAQLPLLKLWEELGKHHDRIQVVGDANMLVKLPLAQVSKRVFLRYLCVMREKWDFPRWLATAENIRGYSAQTILFRRDQRFTRSLQLVFVKMT